MALPPHLEQAVAYASLVSTTATAIGVFVAVRGFSQWRAQRKHDARTAAAVRIAQAMFRAVQLLEAARFRMELSADLFVLAVKDASDKEVLLREHRFDEELRADFPPGTAAEESSAARMDAVIHLPEATPLVDDLARFHVGLAKDQMDLKNGRDPETGRPAALFREAFERLTGERFQQKRDLEAAIERVLAPIARHDGG